MKNKMTLHKTVLSCFCLTALLSMASCDPLGMEPTTMVDQDRFWENPQLSREYVNNFYTWTQAATGDTFQSEQWSDNCQGNIETDWNTYNQRQFNERSYDSEKKADSFDPQSAVWDNSYKHIRAINIGIERISTSSALTESAQNQLLAECYFFRAWEYFEMEKYWGTVPYVDKVLSLTDETFLPRIKREQLFDNILADLTKAIEYFTAFGGTPDNGMITADAVEAFRSRVALHAASAASASAVGLYNFDDNGNLFKFEKASSHYYQIAYDAARSLIGKYTLEEEYKDLFTSANAHKSTESIWPVMFNKANRGGFNPTGKNGPDGDYYGNSSSISLKWNIRSGLFPTQDLVDCYLQKDEANGEWKKWWETTQTQELSITVVDGKIKGTGEEYRKIFKNRDERFYSTVTYDGSYMSNEEEPEARYQIQTWIDNSTIADKTLKYSSLHTGYRNEESLNSVPGGRGSAQTITGYYSRKYSHFDMLNSDGSLNTEQRSTCYFNIRYAEVLLNCAEAGIKLGKADAIGYINEIRNRAGLGDYTGNDLMAELKMQKRLEFAFECPGFRYFDLLRWGEADGLSVIPELNRPSRGLHIFRKGVKSEIAGENGYPAAQGVEGYFTPHFETVDMNYENYQRKFNHPRFYFMPFPQTTITSYIGLVQNPGWSDYKYTN